MGRFPDIETVFDVPQEASNQLLYGEVIRNVLKRTLPADIFDGAGHESTQKDIDAALPIITSSPLEDDVTDISFYCILKHRLGVFKFFYEMLINWLVPGKQLDVVMLYAVDFRIPQVNRNVYTMCEVMVRVQGADEMRRVRQNFPTVVTELRLGVESAYHARRILEVKGLSADLKTAMIQEHIFHVMNRLSHAVDHDVLTEMQHVLVMCRDDFKAIRDSRHLSRIIITQYLFRKGVYDALKREPDKRHVALKLFRSNIGKSEANRQVLCLVVGMTFLKDKELFNQGHLLNAIQTCLPSVKAVDHSFFSNRRGNEQFCTLYIEIEKEDGTAVTNPEMTILRRDLPRELKAQIGLVMNPVFMPRNEEEIMRNILSLSAQIKFTRDIPQLFIQFDEQTQRHLYFTVIAVRVVSPGSPSIEHLFREKETSLEYIHDRCKSIGILRKKYAKEVTVFRVKLSKTDFLRRDQSIDLYKARQEVVIQLVRVLGEFRDFNGGMISKQHELLEKVKELIGEMAPVEEELLEKFFYSLQPDIMRTVLEPSALKQLFEMQLDSQRAQFPEGEKSVLDIRQTPTHLFTMVKTENQSLNDSIQNALEPFGLASTEKAESYLAIHDFHYYGYLYRCDDPVKQWQYQQAVRAAVMKSRTDRPAGVSGESSFLRSVKNRLGIEQRPPQQEI